MSLGGMGMGLGSSHIGCLPCMYANSLKWTMWTQYNSFAWSLNLTKP